MKNMQKARLSSLAFLIQMCLSCTRARNVVEYAHGFDVSVEGELGFWPASRRKLIRR
jgi:hypothetical protein